MLTAFEADNYGAILIRVLPKLFFAQISNINYDHMLMDNRITKPKEFCELLGIKSNKIFSRDRSYIFHLEEAIIPSFLNPHGHLEQIDRDFYSKIRLNFGKNQNTAKIYVSAANSQIQA